MPTKNQIELLKKASELAGGRENLQEEINKRGLRDEVTEALTDPKNAPVSVSKTVQDTTIPKVDIATQQKQVQDLERQRLAEERGIEDVAKKETTEIVPDIKETPKIEEAPKIEEIKEEPAPVITPTGLPESIESWKSQGSNIADLERMIETQNKTTITNENGVLKGMIDGVEYQWNIDTAGNPIKTKVGGENSQDIYNRLLAGEELPDTGIKTTKEYSNAKARYDIVSKYIGMSEDQLYNAYVGGKIGTNIEKAIVENPNLAVAKARFDSKNKTDDINKNNITILNSFKKEEDDYEEPKEEKSFLEKLSDTITASLKNQGTNVLSFKQHMAENYPDLVSDTKELNQKNLELKELVDTRNGNLARIIKNNPGITIRKATMLATRQNKDINEQIKSMSYELGNLQANINYQTDIADKEFSYQLANQTRADKLAAEQRATALGLYGTAQAQQFKLQQIEGQRKYEQEQLADKRIYEQDNQGIKTQIITDPSTGHQALINSQTGETIKTYDTGVSGSTGKWSKFDDNTLYNTTTGVFKDIKTGVTKDYQGNVDYSETDFSTNPAYNTLEASFKNNNPTGITWGVSNELKKLWDEQGVAYSIGTSRPTKEGGNYVKFANVQDGLDAYTIALTQRGEDIEARLKKWVGTKNDATNQEYADDLMNKAGIEKGTKFSDLSDKELESLMAVQLKRESPKFYQALIDQAEVQAPIGGNEQNFAYADKLTASGRTKFLKDKGIEDAYIAYKVKQSSKGADFSDIQDITDITFPEKVTQYNAKSFGFGNRMDKDEKVLSAMDDRYKKSGTFEEFLAPRGEGVPGFAKSSERQQYEQAKRDFINAVLRQESGAAIAPSEFESAEKQYFPQTGDTNETLDQKKRNRETVTENMYRASGKDSKGRDIINIHKFFKSQKPTIQTVTPDLDFDNLVDKYSTTTGQSGILDTTDLSIDDLYNKYY